MAETAGYEALQRDAADFVNPAVEIEPAGQLSFMHGFLAEFGLEMPRLSRRHQDEIADTLEAHEGFRIVPTRLPRFVWQRKAQAVPARDSQLRAPVFTREPGILHVNEDIRQIPTVQPWSWLWLAPGGAIRVETKELERSFPLKGMGEDRPDQPESRLFNLRYKAPGGRILSRERYLGALVAAGQAIEERDAVWTFPVMDISDRYTHEYVSAENQYSKIDPITSPEARINVQLLHLAAGRPKNEDMTEYVNEAIYEVSEQGHSRDLHGVAGVTWSKQLNRIRFAWWYGQTTYDEAEVPDAVSGINNPV